MSPQDLIVGQQYTNKHGNILTYLGEGICDGHHTHVFKSADPNHNLVLIRNFAFKFAYMTDGLTPLTSDLIVQ